MDWWLILLLACVGGVGIGVASALVQIKHDKNNKDEK